MYADVDPVLWGAAELSVRAQLAYLQQLVELCLAAPLSCAFGPVEWRVPHL